MIANLDWRKSSYSVANSACVEVAIVDAEPGRAADSTTIAVRDSKNPDGAHLTYRAETWRWFIDDIRAGRIRRP